MVIVDADKMVFVYRGCIVVIVTVMLPCNNDCVNIDSQTREKSTRFFFISKLKYLCFR